MVRCEAVVSQESVERAGLRRCRVEELMKHPPPPLLDGTPMTLGRVLWLMGARDRELSWEEEQEGAMLAAAMKAANDHAEALRAERYVREMLGACGLEGRVRRTGQYSFETL